MRTPVLRAIAVAIALAAVADPGVERGRTAPLPVEVRTADGLLVPPAPAAGVPVQAVSARAQLAAALGDDVSINTAAPNPAAAIVVGTRIVPNAVPSAGPVFFLSPGTAPAAAVVLTDVRDPRPVLPGWTATIAADVTARGVTPGSTSSVVLESHGLELDRVEHRWTAADQTFEATLAFTPPATGTSPLQLRVIGPANVVDTAGVGAPARVLAEGRRLRVLAFDARPSWASGFVRRALEQDPDFEVVTQVGASKGLEVRTGAIPDAITAATLEPFDVVLVGAPEDLTTSQVAALDSFARVRGGSVVIVADRRPTGRYAALLAAGVFEETLIDKPMTLTAADGTRLRASELTYPRQLPAGAESLLTIPHPGGPRAAMVALPVGRGRVVFSGALDAWRYRADEGAGFERFWRSLIGRAAMAAPRRIEVTVEPGTAVPGKNVLIRAEVRATELEGARGRVGAPAVGAEVIDARGQSAPVRLWPGAEGGLFEGGFVPSGPGRFIVRVAIDGGATAESPLVVEGGDAAGGVAEAPTAALIAKATGGAVLTPSELAPLLDALRALPRAAAPEIWRPMRSAWWAVAFAALLYAEWTLRRRSGLR